MFDDSHIFLSYVNEDTHEVEALYQQLTGAGFNVWMDKRRLLAGHSWTDEIEEAMERSELVIICLSRVSIQKRSFWQREVRKALELSQERPDGEIYLIPVRLDNCEIPHKLAGIQWVDLFAKNGWDHLAKAVTASLSGSRSGAKKLLPPEPEVEVTPSRYSPKPRLRITWPPDAERVEYKTFIEGHVSDPTAAVWLVVHPIGISAYWVQPPVNVREGGRWGVEAYFGRGNELDVGKRFEIMAVANPKEELTEELILGGWPAAEERSQVVMVTRCAAKQPDAPLRLDVPRSTGDRSVSANSVNRGIIITGDGNSVNLDGVPRPHNQKTKRR